MLRDQVAGTAEAAHRSGRRRTSRTPKRSARVDEAQRRNKKFSLLGLNIGPTFGPARTGDFTFNGRAPVLLAVRRRRQARRAGAGRIHVLPRAGRKASSISVSSTAGATCRRALSPASSASRCGQYQAGRRARHRPPSCWTTSSSGGRIGAFVTRGLQELRDPEQRHAGAGRVPADVRPRRQPAGHQLPVRHVGRRSTSRAIWPI